MPQRNVRVRMMSVGFVGAWLCLTAILLGLGFGGLAEAAAVRMYSHNDEPELEAFVAALRAETGLDIQVLRLSSGEAWARIQAESPNFGADVMFGMMHSLALRAVDEGFLHPYVSPEWESVPGEFKDPDGYWYGWSYWFNAFIVNTELVDELGLDIPRSWRDLLDPQYRGEIVMPDPGTSGTAYLMLATIMQLMGEEAGWDYLSKLHRNVGQYTKSGTAPAQLVAQGEYAIGITWDQAIFQRIEAGFPVVAVLPEEGVGYDLDVVWIFNGARDLEAAKQVIDFIGSERGMTLAGQYRSKVTRPGIPSLVDFDPPVIAYDAVWAAENQDRIMAEWRRRFSR